MISNYKTCSNTWLFLFCITGSLTVVSPISAEPLNEDETSPAVKGDSSVKGKPVSAKTDSAIETIVVTGQKIERSLQDTKESVEIFTQKTIEERGMTSLEDVYEQTAGVSGTRHTLRIRGIGNESSDGTRSELSSIYVDGVAMSGWLKTQGPRQLWDVEQVEVLRGPQSTNLGRNALAGAVVIKTIDPEYDNTAALRVGFSEFGGREYKAMGNVNLIDGVSALRISVEDSQTDGHVHNITRSSTRYDVDERKNIRLKWLLEPADNLRMVFSAQHINNKAGDSRVRFDVPGYSKDDRVNTSNDPARLSLDANLASFIVDYDINENWSLKSITAAVKGNRDRIADFDRTSSGLSDGGGLTLRNADDKNFSQEFRFNYQGDHLTGSTGVYYNKTEYYNEADTKAEIDLLGALTAQLGAPTANALIGGGFYPASLPVAQGGFSDIETKNYAFFTEWEWELDEAWLLTAGFRYNYEQQEIITRSTSSFSAVLPVPPGGGLGAVVNAVNNLITGRFSDKALLQTSTDFEAFLPHAGVTYYWDDETSVSFFVKQGYRAGGAEVSQLTGNPNSFDSEYLLNYEIAFRSTILDGQGFLNANVYYSSWRDKQVRLPEDVGNSSFLVNNAGKAKMQGLELAFGYDFSDELSLFATAGVNRTEFKKFQTLTNDFEGNQFSLAPKYTGAAGFNYQMENGIFVNSNLTFQGKYYSDDANERPIGGRVLANIRGGYQTDAYKFELYLNNVLDKTYVTQRFGVSGNEGRLGNPRMLGARATVYF